MSAAEKPVRGTFERRYCAAAGRLVAARFEIPTAEIDFVWANGPTIGCSNLVCSGCGKKVGQRPGLIPVGDPPPSWEDPTDPAEWDRLVAAGALVPDPVHRLYACACAVRPERQFRDLDYEPDNFTDPVPPWSCAGHQRPAAGDAVDGVAIGRATDFAGLVHSSFAESLPQPRPAFTDEYPACWVHRLYRLFHHDPLAAELSRAVAESLRAPQPAARGTAIDFFIREAESPGAEEVARAALRSSELYLGIEDGAGEASNLSQRLRVAVARRLDATAHEDSGEGEETRRAARRAAVWESPNPLTLLRALARWEPGWLAAGADRILAANPTVEVAGDLLFVLGSELPDMLVRVARGLAHAELLPQRDLGRLIEAQFQGEVRQKLLAAVESPR